VLDSGLVEITREGGRNLPALYFLTRGVIQAAPPTLGGPQPPTPEKILGGPQPPIDEKTGGSQPPNWGSATPKENGSYRRSRARLNRNAISNVTAPCVTESTSYAPAKEERPGEAIATEPEHCDASPSSREVQLTPLAPGPSCSSPDRWDGTRSPHPRAAVSTPARARNSR
jgi:hypothetical protein